MKYDTDDFSWWHPWLTILIFGGGGWLAGWLLHFIIPREWVILFIFAILLLATIVWLFRNPLFVLLAIFIGLGQ
jgi:hypothetical protein